MKRIYISGKISGLQPEDYLSHFKAAEERWANYSVINPAKVNAQMPSDTTYEEYMDMSFTMLKMCDTIYMLNNWQDSRGARMEYEYAMKHNYNFIFEGEENGEEK